MCFSPSVVVDCGRTGRRVGIPDAILVCEFTSVLGECGPDTDLVQGLLLCLIARSKVLIVDMGEILSDVVSGVEIG